MLCRIYPGKPFNSYSPLQRTWHREPCTACFANCSSRGVNGVPLLVRFVGRNPCRRMDQRELGGMGSKALIGGKFVRRVSSSKRGELFEILRIYQRRSRCAGSIRALRRGNLASLAGVAFPCVHLGSCLDTQGAGQWGPFEDGESSAVTPRFASIGRLVFVRL